MNRHTSLSDEVLNAYLDGELDEAAQERVFEALRHDADAQARLCALRDAQDAVRHAYRNPPRPSARPGGPKAGGAGRWLWPGAAALLLMVAGAASGWLAHGQLGTPAASVAARADQPSLETLLRSPSAASRVILHVTTNQPQQLRTALDDAEELLERARDRGSDVQLEIIANADGLDLLRADTSPYAERIAYLEDHYANLRLLACQKAIQRLEERGIDVKLLPESEHASSALEQIVKRMQEGWVYIKV